MNRTNASLQDQTTSFLQPAQGMLQRKCTCGNHTAGGGECGKCQNDKMLGQNAGLIQPKLKVSQPNDKYEQEADRVAEQVMRMPEPKEKNAFHGKTNTDLTKSGLLVGNSEISIQRREAFEQEDDRGEQIRPRAINQPQRQQETNFDEDEDFIQAKASLGYTPQVAPNVAANIQNLRGGGLPLPPNQRHFFESRMGQDFSGVRIHTEAKAADTAQAIQAKAFTLGNNIVFNTGQYSHDNQEGKKLLAHELTHVVQQNGVASVELKRTPTPFDTIQRDGPSEVQPCTDLGSCLGRIAMIADSQRRNPQSANNVVDDLLAQLRGPLISNPNTLREMTQEVSESFSTRVFGIFLNRLETDARSRGEISPLEQMRAQQAHQRTIRQMQDLTAPRRGPYGTRGPGVAFPVIAGVLHPLYNAYRSARGFIRGVIGGFRQAAQPRDYQRLVEKLAGSVIITSVFPVVFVAGAIVGIVRDIVGAIVGIYRAVVNFDEVVASAKQILAVMFSDQGEQLGEELGTQTGIGYVGKLRSLLSQNIFTFTFNLGRIIGPTIIYTILSLLGLPVLLGASGLSLRVINAIRAILRRVPGARKLQALLRLRRIRQRQALADGAGALVVHGGRVRLTIARLLEWERLGGHMLQRHGPFHTREILLRRILNETSLGGPPPSRNLPGGARTTDFRVWQGNRAPHASVWRSQQEMLDAVGEIIGDNITDIQRVTAGGSEVVLSRIPLNRHVGNGWVTAIRGSGERGIYWADNLQHATVVIRPVTGGGWRIHTAYPEL